MLIRIDGEFDADSVAGHIVDFHNGGIAVDFLLSVSRRFWNWQRILNGIPVAIDSCNHRI
jgi:hypothetical protein